jgi:hypothetical protein
MDWLSNFFQAGFTTAGALGLAAFAMLVIVALVAIVVAISKGSLALVGVGVFAIISVLGLVVFNHAYPSSPPLQEIPRDGKVPARPPPATGTSPRWFDTGLQADWGGKDSFYGAGEVPIYEADGRKFCDDNLLGRVVTCWSSRAADDTSMAKGVPTNIKEKRNDWCAYKDNSVTLARAPDGRAPPGRVYACAHSISP